MHPAIDRALDAIEFYQSRGWYWRTVAEFLLSQFMATQHGYKQCLWLRRRGWKVKIEPPETPVEEMSFGDPAMIDPVTQLEHSPAEGVKIQAEREMNGGLGI